MDAELGLYAAFFACVLAAGFLAWRSVSRNPSHPEHGRRPYFIGGKVPVTRLGAAAAAAGLVSVVTLLLLGRGLRERAGGDDPAGSGRRGPRPGCTRPRRGAETGISRSPSGSDPGRGGDLGHDRGHGIDGREIQSIACPNPEQLRWGRLGPRGRIRRTGDQWHSGSVMSIPGSDALSSISCPTATRCIAVGSGPAMIVGSW